MSLSDQFTPFTSGILVIEDDLYVAALVTDILHFAGHHTRTVTNGTKALEMIARYHPTLILLDLHTPGFLWYQIVAQLDQHRCAAVPIIAVTGASPIHEVEISLRIATIIYKPFDLNEFVTCVTHYMVTPNNTDPPDLC